VAGDDHESVARAVSAQHPGRFDDRATRGDHVVDDHTGTIANVADHLRHLDALAVHPTLHADRDRPSQVLRELGRTLHAAQVRGDNDGIVGETRFERAAHDREDRQVVDRDPEKPLDLRRVRVECHDMVDADGLHHVGDGACGDGHATSRPLVGSRVREVGDDGRDAVRVGTPARIDDHEQLDQVVIHRR
jgi:hypothetical protein